MRRVRVEANRGWKVGEGETARDATTPPTLALNTMVAVTIIGAMITVTEATAIIIETMTIVTEVAVIIITTIMRTTTTKTAATIGQGIATEIGDTTMTPGITTPEEGARSRIIGPTALDQNI